MISDIIIPFWLKRLLVLWLARSVCFSACVCVMSEARLSWLAREVSLGRAASVSFSYNSTNMKETVKLVLLDDYAFASFYRPGLLSAIAGVTVAMQSSIVTDKGHRSHSNGTTIIEFWISCRGGSFDAPVEPRAQAAVGARSGDCRGSGHLAEDAPMDVENFSKEPANLVGAWTEIDTPSFLTDDHLWSMDEIGDWSRVTVRLANDAANDALEEGCCKQTCLDKRSEVIRQRWLSAEPHIPESLHGGLQQILHEM